MRVRISERAAAATLCLMCSSTHRRGMRTYRRTRHNVRGGAVTLLPTPPRKSSVRASCVSNARGNILSDDALQIALSNADPTAVSAWLRDHVRDVAERGGRTESTRRAYTAAALRILPFLQAHGLSPSGVSAEIAAAALYALGTGMAPYREPCAASSVRLTATAVRVALVAQGFDPSPWTSPVVRAVLRDLDARAAPKAINPIRLEDLKRMVSVVAPSSVGVRIRAALLVLYGGALRVSELSSLTWQRIGGDGVGLVLQVRRKRHTAWCNVSLRAATDGTLCAVRALSELRALDCAPDTVSIFGSPRTVQGWVAALATRAGLRGACSPHSLRHGWASDAASAGVPLPAIQRHLGHASAITTSRYASHAELRQFY